MALTNSERQRRFKMNAALKDNGLRRVEVWLSTAAALSLKQLATHGKTSNRDILERLLLAEKTRITETMSDAEFEVFISP